MERFADYISDRMNYYHLISESDKIFYSYSLQLFFEKTIGLILICFFAFIFDSLIETLLFLLIFILIRKYSDGFHCKTTIGCWGMSVLISLSTIVVGNTLCEYEINCQGGVTLSIIFVIIVGTINNPELNLTPEELCYLKRHSRIMTLSVGLFVILLLQFSEIYKYSVYLGLGVIYNALSIGLAKILRKEDSKVYA